MWNFRRLTVSSFGKWVCSLKYLSWTISSISNSLPWDSMSPSFLMLVNLTIASSDVCRVNKRGNYLILIAPLYIEITLFEIIVLHLPLIFALTWCCSTFMFLPLQLSLGYVWTHRKLFITSNIGIMFTWIKHGSMNLLCCSCAYSHILVFSDSYSPSWHLASSLWFKIWNLCWLIGIIFDWSSNKDSEWH